MGWKKKEKPLTPEQAIEMAKKELAPLWYNSEPLLAAVRVGEGASVLPLNSKFVETPWIYFFIDPTEFAGERALLITREWYKRYAEHKVNFLIVFRAALPFMKTAAEVLKKKQIQFPAVCDQENLIATAFGINAWPAVVMQNGKEEITRGAGANWSADSEEKLQFFLRRADPGLSLELPFQLKDALKGHSRIDFGTVGGKTLKALGEMVQVSGVWTENEDSIMTSDSTATAIIKTQSPVVAIIAQSGNEKLGCKILIESMDGALGGDNVPETASMDEMGRTMIRIQHFGLHFLLLNLPRNRHTFKLSFPDAGNGQVRIFGLRFGSN